MIFVIDERCVDVLDSSCVDVCPSDCIYEGKRSRYINPNECIGCSACEIACPVGAISAEVELGVRGAVLRKQALEWVTTHAAVGTASERGPVGIDHPAVADLPHS